MVDPALVPEFLAPQPPHWGLVNGFSLPLMGMLAITGYALLVPPDTSQARRVQTFELSLRDSEFEVSMPTFGLPKSDLPGHAGGSNHRGDDARDASLNLTPEATRVSTLTPEVESPVAPKALDVSLPTPGRLVDPGLPLQPGGNGVVRGYGHGFGRGLGDELGNGVGQGSRPAAREVRMDQLTVIRQSIPRYVYARGESFGDTVVIIQVSLDLDGVPRDFKALRGEAKLIEVAMKSVKDWRFHIPDHFKQEVPLTLKLRFNFLKL